MTPSAPVQETAVQEQLAELSGRLEQMSGQLGELTAALAAEQVRRERMSDLVEELNRITGSGMATLSDLLADAERRGWFAAARQSGSVAGQLATVMAHSWPAAAPSARSLVQTLRDRRTRLGLARLLALLQALGADAATTAAGRTTGSHHSAKG